MGSVASALRRDLAEGAGVDLGVEHRVFDMVVKAMNEYELEQYREHRPSIPRLWVYYLENILCLVELPLHWLYHFLFCLVLAVLLTPYLVFECFCVRTEDRRRQGEEEDCGNLDLCDYCFDFQQLHEPALNSSAPQAVSPPRDDLEVGVAEAVKVDKEEGGLDTATALNSNATAQEYVEPGLYLSIVRLLEHHDYLLKAYGALLWVLMWNLIAPLTSCTCENLVTYLSEEYYFIPLERPPKPPPRLLQRETNDCCDDDCCRYDANGGEDCCDECVYAVFCSCCCDNCCGKTCCRHDLVHCDSYRERYDYRVRSNLPKSLEEEQNEYSSDRASAIGVGRRHPERFVRSLFITFTGLQGLHPAKSCGPLCRNQFDDFSARAQKWHDEMQAKSEKETQKFYQESFGFNSYQELLAHERGPSTGEAITQVASKTTKGIAPRVQKAMTRMTSRKKADV